MSMSNLSSKFLTPVLDLNSPVPVYEEAFKNTYLGMEGFNCEYGKCFFMLYSDKINPTLEAHFESHPMFTAKLEPKEGERMFVFTVPEDKYYGVVSPFVRGEYSKIDRGYVNEKFPKDPYGKLRLNRRILDNDLGIRKEWARKIGVDVSLIKEAWSRAKEADEIYGTIKEENLDLAN